MEREAGPRRISFLMTGCCAGKVEIRRSRRRGSKENGTNGIIPGPLRGALQESLAKRQPTRVLYVRILTFAPNSFVWTFAGLPFVHQGAQTTRRQGPVPVHAIRCENEAPGYSKRGALHGKHTLGNAEVKCWGRRTARMPDVRQTASNLSAAWEAGACPRDVSLRDFEHCSAVAVGIAGKPCRPVSVAFSIRDEARQRKGPVGAVHLAAKRMKDCFVAA
jgi:hypothetical protein